MASDGANSLWIGGLEPYMTEKFLLQSFKLVGEQPRSIKVMRKNGLPAGYGFCQFQDKKQATEALHKLNGKIIPNSQPPRCFKLDLSKNSKGSTVFHKVRLVELSADVDDYTIYKYFSGKYDSVQSAIVVRDSNGESCGFAIVNFSNEEDPYHAVIHLQGETGLGSNPLRLFIAESEASSQPDQPQDDCYIIIGDQKILLPKLIPGRPMWTMPRP